MFPPTPMGRRFTAWSGIPALDAFRTSWVGSWRNQFGSILRITSDAEGRIDTFGTALDGAAPC